MKTVKPFVTDSPIVSKQGKVVPCQLKHSSPTEILGRVIDPQNPSFTREAAQSVLELQFPLRDVTRMNELAENNTRGHPQIAFLTILRCQIDDYRHRLCVSPGFVPCRDKSWQKKLAASLKTITEKFVDDLRRLAQ